MTYRIDNSVEDHENKTILKRRSDAWRRRTFLVLGTFFVGLGTFGICWIFYRSLGEQNPEGGLLPILFGLSVAVLCFGVRIGLIKGPDLPDQINFNHADKMALIPHKTADGGLFKIPYDALNGFLLARTVVQTAAGGAVQKQVRYRVCLLTNSLACWTLFERVGAQKQKAPREAAQNFFRRINSEILLRKSASATGCLDVNGRSVAFLTDDYGQGGCIQWRSPFDWPSLWALGVPMGLLFSLFVLWSRMADHRVWVAFIIGTLLLLVTFLAFRIARSCHHERVLEFRNGRFRAYFTGSKFPDEVNFPVDRIGVFRFEPAKIGSWPKLFLVPKKRHESDREHYEIFKDEELALKSHFRTTSARPLREKWVKSFEARGLDFVELVYLEAWLNHKLAEHQKG